ncbi:adenosylmethionine--8-amino-7-oxononanoate transaminase, partial [Campylobacter sp.]|uniref:adenosylmethionine--8-amino-7-oxononanoate transaminase n=1 Tax=Campylobacter sp. TaxID=205 RepID=UPI002AA7BCF1
QMSEYDSVLAIKRGDGAVLYGYDEKAYIDCISSWWVNIFGHGNAYIAAKIAEQAKNLSQVILAGFTHEPLVRLSSRLCKLLPSPLNKCFYADNGSAAVEVALKMSYHKNKLTGKEKPLFLNLKNSYHGETIGALSVGDVELYKASYGGILIDCISAEVPCDFSAWGGEIVSEDEALSDLEKVLKTHAHRISAFIIEPLIQCSGNMNMPSPAYTKKACELVRSYEIDVIFDEIAVGFGRSGSMWAMEQVGFVPDFVCLSKGLSGGNMPFSVVVTSNSVYNEFLGDFDRAFLHSHSYTGNALAAAAANATLDIFESENVIEKNKALSAFILEQFKWAREHEKVRNFRQRGMVLAFDVPRLAGAKSREFRSLALNRGLLLRPLGASLYFMPPYVITRDQIAFASTQIKELINEL